MASDNNNFVFKVEEVWNYDESLGLSFSMTWNPGKKYEHRLKNSVEIDLTNLTIRMKDYELCEDLNENNIVNLECGGEYTCCESNQFFAPECFEEIVKIREDVREFIAKNAGKFDDCAKMIADKYDVEFSDINTHNKSVNSNENSDDDCIDSNCEDDHNDALFVCGTCEDDRNSH